KTSAFEHSDGIGWFYGNPMVGDRGAFLPKDRLKKVGDATLRDGTPVVIHAFGGLAYCDVGGRFGDLVFKPFVRFTSKAGEVFRNWDERVVGDYSLALSHRELDRNFELLGR